MLGIHPIRFNKYPLNLPNQDCSVSNNNQDNLAQHNTVKPFNCAFLGNYIPNFESVDLTPALDIGDVCCPVCGVQTLSKNKYENLVKVAENIDNPAELMKFFKANINYIPRFMRATLFANSEKYLEESNLTISDYFTNCIRNAGAQTRNHYTNIENYLLEYAKTLPNGELRTAVEDLQQKINSRESYDEFKHFYFDFLKRDDIDKTVKKQLEKDLFDKVRYSRINMGGYNLPNYAELPQNELSKQWVAKIFSNSIITHSKFHNYDDERFAINNSVLTCSRCNAARSKNSKVFMDFRELSNPAVSKFFIKNYLSNVAKLMGEGKIIPNRHYFNNFTYYVNKFSKGDIKFYQSDIDKLATVRALSYRREEFAPIEQHEVDIPCACCGSIMLPHSKRLDIQFDLLNANTLSDYAEILKANQKYIGTHLTDLNKIFFDVYNKNPNISKEDFINEFTTQSKKVLTAQVKKSLKNYEKGIRYLEANGAPVQIEFAYTVKNRLNDYISSGAYDDFNYTNMIKHVFEGLDLNSFDCTKPVFVLLNDLKLIAYKSATIDVDTQFDNSDKDKIFTLLFNMFKFDVATADHLHAVKKGGIKKKENLIGLCRGCNSLKSNKSVEGWYTQTYPVRINLRKQLQVVDEMAKNGLIEGFENWANGIAEDMYNSTRGKYDIRNEFKKS